MSKGRVVAVLLLSCTACGMQARADPDPPLWERCYDAIPWHFSADVPNTERVMKDLVGRGALAAHRRQWIQTEIERAPTIASCLEKARAERKLLLWYVPVVEGQHMVLPHLLDRYLMVGPWSHPDVVELVRRRYVAIRLPAGGALGREYGLRAPTFLEPGLLVFTADGHVVHRMDRINTFAPDHFLDLLVTLVERHGAARGHSASYEGARARVGQTPGDANAWLALADEAIREGEHAEAEAALAKASALEPNAGRMLYLSAVLARRQRRGDAALVALEKAAHRASDVGLLRDVSVERGRIHVKEGRFPDAARVLADVVKGRGDGVERRAEAAYYLGIAQYLSGNETDAKATWRRAAEWEPESLWAAKADACAAVGSDDRLGESALTRAMTDPRWLAPETYRPARDTQWRRAPDDAADIRTRALTFLLAQQRSDGSWPGFRWGDPGKDESHNRNIDVAIAALCCAALHAWREEAPENVDVALGRGETYLLDDTVVERGDAVAWVYADAFRLRHFAARVGELPSRLRGRVKKSMRRWIRHLLAHQEENDGSFRHYVYQSTFVTAAVTSCLRAAKQAGFRVPDAAFSRAAAVLEGARGPNGLFGYLLDNPAATRSKLGAAARQPLCVLALNACGSADDEDLGAAVRIYLETYERSTAVARKANFHIPALDHTAGYYFFHDFHAACEAARAADDDGAPLRSDLLAKLCALPEIDGTFVDSGFSYGKCYGTAMALLSMRALQGPGER